MTLKIDNAIEEIERALAGNKPKYANDIYLNNAIRYLQEIKSPSLTDDQQVVLDWLKNYVSSESVTPIDTVGVFWKERNFMGQPPKWRMNSREQAQVLQAFSQWVLEQEEE